MITLINSSDQSWKVVGNEDSDNIAMSIVGPTFSAPKVV